MTNIRIDIGKRGETLAISFLKKNGYRIIESNFRCRYGEIDIIAQDGKTVAFIEVKTKTSNRFGSPTQAVDSRKQRQVSKTALAYISQKRLTNYSARFDVVGINIKGSNSEIELIKNAFELCL
ncbi:MAG TPA: YraN family protein [Deltaproteobacteria bacterium]|nr:MAG: YraN family protein [Deltaproteobacteria bacterium GWD2_42_10]OGP47753.1 MAG: YraN family protein [Deltaproteobacteria bacterium GWF2_42_12]OGQ26275.1 MAG: YraN family protein [Deltaproteobacteria bacterium RIFCSPHIGHO2_02_FULL_42_44]HAG50953.1 YraN family protein [Deltaproteobacteria bacterium]